MVEKKSKVAKTMTPEESHSAQEAVNDAKSGDGYWRVKFHTKSFEPVKFPPTGPYWNAGTSADESFMVVVGYLKERADLKEYWPSAFDISISDVREEIEFHDRFQKPDWWEG